MSLLLDSYSKNSSAKRILDLFARLGTSDYIGEPVSIRQHSLQAPAISANLNASDQLPELILACLLHDIGIVVMISIKFRIWKCLLNAPYKTNYFVINRPYCRIGNES
jgi:hypothetical protein